MRTIDADALKKTLEDMCSASNNIKQRQVEDIMLHNIFPQIIDDEPTIEAETVKHGRWLDNGMVYTCSECNSSVPKNIFVIGCDFEGCPYCFARMDGENNGKD